MTFPSLTNVYDGVNRSVDDCESNHDFDSKRQNPPKADFEILIYLNENNTEVSN